MGETLDDAKKREAGVNVRAAHWPDLRTQDERSVGSMRYRELLLPVATNDVAVLEEKDKHYKGSWKRRGGVGAYMMLCRKWDRIEAFVEDEHAHNVFDAIANDTRTETVEQDIADLRRYLMLVEAEMRARRGE